MRDHSECDAAYEAALARGRDGYAEYVMQRCDLTHGRLTTTTTEAAEAGNEEQR